MIEGVDNEIIPIQVQVELKDSQQIDENKWKYTMRGNTLIVSRKVVVWHTLSMQAAINSINIDEVKSFTIKKGKNIPNINHTPEKAKQKKLLTEMMDKDYKSGVYNID